MGEYMKKLFNLSRVTCNLSSGFTLIEMLVTIAIIAIVSGVIIVGINPAKRIQDAQDSRARQDVRSMASAIEACLSYADPVSGATNLPSACQGPETTCGVLATTTPLGGPFARAVPTALICSITGTEATAIICAQELGFSTWKYSTATGQVVAGPCP